MHRLVQRKHREKLIRPVLQQHTGKMKLSHRGSQRKKPGRCAGIFGELIGCETLGI